MKVSNVLVRTRKKWMLEILFSRLLLAISFGIVASIIFYKISLPVFIPVIIVVFISAAFLFSNRWKISQKSVSGHLNILHPSLQESAHLILKHEQSLNLLEKLQLEKVRQELLSLQLSDPFRKKFLSSLLMLLIASVISIALFSIPFTNILSNTNNTSKQNSSAPVPEGILAEIQKADIIITPPPYTGKNSRQQSSFNLSVEEGAIVSWQIQTNVQVQKVQLVFNDGSILSLANANNHVGWKAQKQIKTSGFYQVKIDNKLSDLYKIEAIKDKPPVITVQSPAPNTYLTYGESEKVIIKTFLSDDYAISKADISATISTGEGEAVKFKEQKLSFEIFSPGNKEYSLQKAIDCKALGMQPGDELYFFINVTDNHNQQTHSDVYIITLQDTANLLSIDGMVTSLDLKQEFFRSERQIIIETEQLLKDKSTISAEKFRTKSNDLGMDQQLLRLRYNKFLGEETNVEVGEDNNSSNQESAEEIIKQFTHEHDNAEDANLFDAATKKQLVSMLTEMWNAELKLRTFLPKDALVYENKALILLKDLQQKSRAYVPKTGFKSTPLKLEKRLTGDLTKITQPQSQQSFQKPGSEIIISRKALGILEQLKTTVNLNPSSKQILQQAFQQLSVAAANQPSVYLPALSSLKKILNEGYATKDIAAAEKGLQKLLPVAEKLPHPINTGSGNLSKQYFINLNKGR